MAEKAFIKSLENFKGLDLKTSKLQGQQENGQLLTNLEYSEARGIRGRTGMAPIGQAGAFTALHTYNYFDPITGATVQQLLALNNTLWVLKTGTLSVTGGANVNWQMTMNPAATSYRFVIQNNVTPYVLGGNNYYDLGLGTESENITTSNPKLITMEALRSTINANATLVCNLPAGIKFAQVNGDQATVNVITVFAGHNYVVNDWMTFWDFATAKLVARKVSAITGTTITFDTLSFPTVTVKANQVIGPMASPATSIGVRDSTALTTDIPFSYWDTIPYTTDFYQMPEQTPAWLQWSYGSNSPSIWRPSTFINSNNCTYFYSKIVKSLNTCFEGFPFKYDGQTAYREGLPRHTLWTGAASGTAGGLSGTYKYKVAYIQYDARGNIIQGRTTQASAAVTVGAALSVDLTLNNMIIEYNIINKGFCAQVNGLQAGVTTITVFSHVASANDWVYLINRATGAYIIRQVVSANSATSITIAGPVITVNNNDSIYFAKNVGFNYNYAQVNGNQANVNTLTVFNTAALPNTLRVGDSAYFYDRRTSKYVSRVVTGTTATTLVIAGDPVNVNNNDPISNNLRIKIWRTKAGGNLFYEVAEIPHVAPAFQIAYNDGLADTSLGAQLVEPPIGKEQDLPPKLGFACNHQGTRCASGDDDNPNTVYIYSTLDPEAIPIASNSFDVQSQMNGPIAAIGSDDDDRLAIFKDHAYYQASGALDDGAFSVQTIREGDFGISSHRSLQKVNGALIGVGPLGVMGVKGGRLLPGFGEGIYPTIANNANVNLGQTVAINDYSSRHYLFFTPSRDMTASGYNNSLSFALDYVNNGAWVDKSYAGMNPQYGMDAWFDRYYTRGYDIGGDMAMYNGVLHSLAFGSGQYPERGRVFKRLMPDTNVTQAANLYWDVNQPIQYVFQPQWLCPDQQISVDKEFLWFKLYASPSTYELERFTSFTATLATYGNFNEGTPVETLTLPQITSTAFESRMKLKSTKLRAISFKVVLATGGQCLYITGFEYVVALTYIPEVPRTT